MHVCVCLCLCVCLCDRRRTQSLNQLTDLVQIRYIGSSCKYLEPFFLVFPLPLKLRVIHIRKKFKFSIFSKVALTILINFFEFIVYSKSNNMALSTFSGKIPETGKIFFIFFVSPNVGPKPTDQSRTNSIYIVLLQISLIPIFLFDVSSKLRVVHIRKKFKILIFSKMAPTILIKFCGFIVYSNLNSMTLSAFPEKIPEIRKIVFFRHLTQRLRVLQFSIQPQN